MYQNFNIFTTILITNGKEPNYNLVPQDGFWRIKETIPRFPYKKGDFVTYI